MRIDGIQPGIPIDRSAFSRRVLPGTDVPSFKETLSTFLNEVNESQKVASEAQKKFMTGEVNDVHQVMSKSEEAKISFNMLMELRNKSLDCFQEMMRTKL